jgi:NAD(P)-dependent dehydrogenase (short-subunit alcohol dehydrogenase family)
MVKADMSKYPLGKRYARPGEIADVIAFLLSDASSFMTGQTVTIDGGYTIQ